MPKKAEKNSSLIIYYELFTGLLEVIFAIGLVVFGNHLLKLYQHIIFSNFLIFYHDNLGDFIESFVPYLLDHLHFVAFCVFLLGTVKTISALGMHYQKWWASYLLSGTLVFLLPFDLVSMYQKFEIYKLVLLVINIAIIWYLIIRPLYLDSRK